MNTFFKKVILNKSDIKKCFQIAWFLPKFGMNLGINRKPIQNIPKKSGFYPNLYRKPKPKFYLGMGFG